MDSNRTKIKSTPAQEKKNRFRIHIQAAKPMGWAGIWDGDGMLIWEHIGGLQGYHIPSLSKGPKTSRKGGTVACVQMLGLVSLDGGQVSSSTVPAVFTPLPFLDVS